MEQQDKHEEIVLPIVLGSVAFYIGKKSPGEHSHRWTIYVRSPDGTDLSSLFEKVVFTLHPSCSQPVVTVTTSPFQVSQTGWGEFEASITFHFRDSCEKPITNTHILRLFPPGITSVTPTTSTTVPVVSEIYDELIFTNPSLQTQNLLKNRMLEPEKGFEELKQWFKDMEKEHDFFVSRLHEANQFITNELTKNLAMLTKQT